MRRNTVHCRAILLLVLVGIPVLLVISDVLILYKKWGIGAACPKCLKGASIRERRLCGMLLHRKTRLHDRFLRSQEVPGNPLDRPLLADESYDRIVGGPCRHDLKKSSFSYTGNTILGRFHADGFFGVLQCYEPRTHAIHALYVAHRHTGDDVTAGEIYRWIDAAFPMAADDKVVFLAYKYMRTVRERRMDPNDRYALLKMEYPETDQYINNTPALEELAERLYEVRIQDQLKAVLKDASKIEGSD